MYVLLAMNIATAITTNITGTKQLCKYNPSLLSSFTLSVLLSKLSLSRVNWSTVQYRVQLPVLITFLQ